MLIAYIDNGNVLTLSSLTNSITAAVDTGATVTVTLKDTSGTEVSGQSWPASVVHVAAGLYQTTLDAALVLQPNRTYKAHVDATGTGGEVGHWEIPVKAMIRGA